jgi:hypothetical protein
LQDVLCRHGATMAAKEHCRLRSTDSFYQSSTSCDLDIHLLPAKYCLQDTPDGPWSLMDKASFVQTPLC